MWDGLRGRRQGVGAWALEYRQVDRLLAVQVAVGDVLARAELDARDILQADQPPVLARLHDYRAELAWRREAALRGHHVLEGVVAVVRRRADGIAGDLHVLFTQRRAHVGGGEAVGGELLRFEPSPQRELALA